MVLVDSLYLLIDQLSYFNKTSYIGVIFDVL